MMLTDEQIQTMVDNIDDPEARKPWEQMLQARAEWAIERADLLAAGDTESLARVLAIAGSEDRAQVFMEIEDKLDDEQARELLTRYWDITEGWQGHPERRAAMHRLLARATTDGPIIDGDGVPTTPTVTIYRGNLGEDPTGVAASWTLDRKIAEKFATQPFTLRGQIVLGMNPGPDDKASIWQAEILRDEMIAWFNGRGEQEVIAAPTSATLIAQAENSDA